MPPRYFLPSGTPMAAPAWRSALATHVLDVFRLPWGSSEAVVVADETGALHLLSDGVPGVLPARCREALARQELTSGRPPRKIAATSLYLFALETVERPVDTPGVNDPVHLAGRLYGPYGQPAAPTCSDGTLTVTWCDLVASLLDDAPDALLVTGGSSVTRALHAMLPGDDAAGTRAGEAIVLVYPVVPPELGADGGNEALCAQWLETAIHGLQAGLRQADISAPAVTAPVPVACLADLLAAWEREGWEIRGDQAVRLDPSLKSGIGGLLTNVLGLPDHLKRKVPREGTLDELLALARDVLAAVPGWPTERYRALRARLNMAPVVAPAVAVPKASDAPRRSVPDPRDDRAIPPPVPSKPASTTRKSKSGAAGSPAKRPDWMDDFE
jgi:hypothetical protein